MCCARSACRRDWVIALVDRNRRFIARIPPLPAGTPVSESFRAAIERSPSGWFAGPTLEGTRTYTPYVTSELSGWVLGIAIPASTVDAAAKRTLIGMGGGPGRGASALALLLGWYMARRIAGAGGRACGGDRGDGRRARTCACPTRRASTRSPGCTMRCAARPPRCASAASCRAREGGAAGDRPREGRVPRHAQPRAAQPARRADRGGARRQAGAAGQRGGDQGARGDRAPDQAHGAAGGRPARHQPRRDGQGGDRARALQPRARWWPT